MLTIRIINPKSEVYGRTFEATRALDGYITLDGGPWSDCLFFPHEAEEVDNGED